MKSIIRSAGVVGTAMVLFFAFVAASAHAQQIEPPGEEFTAELVENTQSILSIGTNSVICSASEAAGETSDPVSNIALLDNLWYDGCSAPSFGTVDVDVTVDINPPDWQLVVTQADGNGGGSGYVYIPPAGGATIELDGILVGCIIEVTGDQQIEAEFDGGNQILTLSDSPLDATVTQTGLICPASSSDSASIEAEYQVSSANPIEVTN